MRKSFSLLITLALIFTLAACGGSQPNENPGPEDEPEPTHVDTFGGDLTGTGGSGVYVQEDVAFPDAGVSVAHVAACGEHIYLCGRAEDGTFRIYSFSAPDRSLSRLPVEASGSVSAICCNAEGGLALLTYVSTEDGGDLIYSLSEYDGSGAFLRELPLDAAFALDNSAVTSMLYCADGLLLGMFSSVVHLNREGGASRVMENFTTPRQLAYSSDGKLLICGESADGYTVTELSADLNERQVYPLASAYDGAHNGASGDRVYLSDANYLYAVDYQSGERETVMSFTSNGIISTAFIRVSETAFFGTSGMRPVILQEMDEGVELVTLKLATYNMDYELRAAVMEFNSRSATYRIDVTDYSTYDISEGSGEGLTRLNTDIIAGSLPDIFDLSHLPGDTYRAMGMLEDLRPYLDAGTPSYGDLIPGITAALDHSGQLFELVPGFKLYTWVTAAELAPSGSWTAEEFCNTARGREGVFGPDMTRAGFIADVLSVCGDEYYDLEGGQCYFDEPGFIMLLEYAATLPETVEDISSNAFYRVYYGEQLVLPIQVDSTIVSLTESFDAMFGGSSVYAGPPASSGAGAYIPSLRVAMSSQSAVKAGIWEFFSYLLSDAY
ncbi:MAG: hypothetical protein Q4B42_05125, partial [Oscillospiraceae bacterium]|nr:hypothetical protein [Oscillospiraceae bacterium]